MGGCRMARRRFCWLKKSMLKYSASPSPQRQHRISILKLFTYSVEVEHCARIVPESRSTAMGNAPT